MGGHPRGTRPRCAARAPVAAQHVPAGLAPPAPPATENPFSYCGAQLANRQGLTRALARSENRLDGAVLTPAIQTPTRWHRSSWARGTRPAAWDAFPGARQPIVDRPRRHRELGGSCRRRGRFVAEAPASASCRELLSQVGGPRSFAMKVLRRSRESGVRHADASRTLPGPGVSDKTVAPPARMATSCVRRRQVMCAATQPPYCGMSTNRENIPWNATVIVSVGPLRCFATMRSASP